MSVRRAITEYDGMCENICAESRGGRGGDSTKTKRADRIKLCVIEAQVRACSGSSQDLRQLGLY